MILAVSALQGVPTGSERGRRGTIPSREGFRDLRNGGIIRLDYRRSARQWKSHGLRFADVFGKYVSQSNTTTFIFLWVFPCLISLIYVCMYIYIYSFFPISIVFLFCTTYIYIIRIHICYCMYVNIISIDMHLSDKAPQNPCAIRGREPRQQHQEIPGEQTHPLLRRTTDIYIYITYIYIYV